MTPFKFMSLTAAATMVVTSLGVAAPAAARDHGYHRYDNSRYDRTYRDYRARDYRAYNNNYYRGNYRNDYRYRCRDNGTGGTIIGAIAGGLIGNEVAGRRGDKTAGTLIGGALGAVAGRAIDKSDSRC